MKAQIRTITPDIATAILNGNSFKNRPLSKTLIDRYAADMEHGKWQANGETIILTKDGSLLDGQHRLNAVVKANTKVDFLVVTGVDQEYFSTIDSGRKRTESDVLSILDVPNAKLVAAICRIVESYKTRASFSVTGSFKGSMETLEKYPAIQDSSHLIAALKSKVISPPSLCAALHFVFAEKSKEQADEFFERLHSMDFTGENCPIKAYHKHFNSYGNSVRRTRFDYNELAARYIRAWNAFRKKKGVSRVYGLMDKNNGELPEII